MNQPLKTIRDNLDLTQEELANLIGIPINTIRNWEQETRKPSAWSVDLLIDRILREMSEKNSIIDESTGILSFLSIKKIVSQVASDYDVDRVYLFGSYAKGEATPISDVDLYIDSNLYGLEHFGFVEVLREKLKKKVDVLSDKIIEKNSKIDEEIKKTGILLYER
ncbi:MAG: nucleotidyltransferase domain-containing protein [Bacilli bacterium]|jgi:hypothetical protein